MLIALIFAVPLVLFLILELFGFARSRRNRAMATRRKGPRAR
jgi:hypothetical protein